MKINEILKEYREEYQGITLDMKIRNHQLIVTALDDWGNNELGHVIFNIGDNDELDPQDLEVDERYQGQGIAKVMYDFVTSHGYEIHRSWDQTPAGSGFWDKHRGKDVRVWEDELNEAGAVPIYYFAYGMLTDPELMPGAEFIGRAELHNFTFEMFTYANVVPDSHGRVYGSLWAIDRQLLSRLDSTEGYPTLYDRKTVPVMCGGERYEAEVYTMTPQTRKYMVGTQPSDSYIARIARGYHNAGIPMRQVQDSLVD